MKLLRKSMISGKLNSLDLPITKEELKEYAKGEKLLQDCFPNCNPGQREFIKTGVTPQEWDEAFPPEED